MRINTNLANNYQISSENRSNIKLSLRNDKEMTTKSVSSTTSDEKEESTIQKLEKQLTKLKEQLMKIEQQISQIQNNDNPYSKDLLQSLNSQKASLMSRIQITLAQMLEATKAASSS
ncbi:hypothetical protein A9K75_06935 [Campylobacter fetus subsp. testudinum]|uniref:hypothetical protein n=1 Tax=Campylobacter fetus TaxID=196 RepID=UPI000818B715|nr:hypothetical protein [Campylobacter fetus]EAK0827275.1 DUF342 domain-containing protein [Campylobacter fetus]OCR95992.1 hypothetical protein CFT12S02847_05930 [Campylobacter fetus subsp. testudinum]OCR97811.1 hypothetical protein CFT12S02855_04940 [Campylobacter fetus subsp. testudinum]OCR99482.1 hypothetical protein A9K75_06935 [Campylobacter fetus subsp. testudinum]OCS03647.1 hypothetical protein AC237_07310 [Campylobacter fetus subsp. testudinum]